MAKITSLKLENWKSLRELTLDFQDINVLIGPNGSGKSNLVQFFQLLNMMMTGNLQLHIGRSGGASSMLHYGPKQSLQIVSEMVFSAEAGIDTYLLRLIHGAPDTLIFAQENVSFKASNSTGAPWVKEFGAGHRESMLAKDSVRQNKTLNFVKNMLSRCRYFQFHDTGSESFIRGTARADDDRFLRHNGGNVAAVLSRLRTDHPSHYSKIVESVRVAVPSFKDFLLEPQSNSVRLEWTDRHAGERFGPHQLSDGSIRFIALMTLFNLPPEMMPSVVIVDEPELGLFPLAVDSLAEAIRDASSNCQVILATQSVRLVRYLKLDSLVCCNWKDGVSHVERLSPMEEFEFLDGYSLGDYVQRGA